MLRHFDQAAGVDHAHRDLGFLGREARQIGFGANDGERALVDRRAVAQIGDRSDMTGLALRSRVRIAAIAAGSSSAATMANGSSRAEPSAISAHPSGVPTTVSAAAGMRTAFGAAGNVDVERPSRCGAAHLGDARRERARGDMRRRADRRARRRR